MHWKALSDHLPNSPANFKARHICIVTSEFQGPTSTGGAASHWGHLALLLAKHGHAVTVLYTRGTYCDEGTFEKWVNNYASKGIKLIPLPETTQPPARGFLSINMRRARLTYEYLKEQPFEIIHFADTYGDGYYCLIAKRLGLAFNESHLCIRAAKPSAWLLQANNTLPSTKGQLLQSTIERKCVELADIVLSPSEYMINWMRDWGYALPSDRCYVLPSFLPATHDDSGTSERQPSRLAEVREIVFFGSMEPRKGIEVFRKAITILHAKTNAAVKYTIITPKQTSFAIQPFSEEEKRLNINILTDLDSQSALEYLSQANRLAVMPSLVDNSPMTVYECLVAGIPFIASRNGGAPELIYADDHDEVLFEPVPPRLAGALERILHNGISVARPSPEVSKGESTWAQLHNVLGRDWFPLAKNAAVHDLAKQPLVSVCITHYNRPDKLRAAIDSLKKQSYKTIEVIIVDDGSTLPEAIAFLDHLEIELSPLNWSIIRQDNRYPGAARNNAARHAKGQYLLFMDDDNIAKEYEVETFVQAALSSGADILTCFADAFSDEEQIKTNSALNRITFTGGDPCLGFFVNCFGDTNCLVNRDSFERLGGFTEDYGIGKEDYELFVRASLSGMQIHVVPEALYWYRVGGKKIRHKHYYSKSQAGLLRALRPYYQAGTLVSKDFLLFARLLGSDMEPSQLTASHPDKFRLFRKLVFPFLPKKMKKLLRDPQSFFIDSKYIVFRKIGARLSLL